MLFILQAAIAAGFLLIIINFLIIMASVITFTIGLAKKFEKEKLYKKPILSTVDMLFLILKAFSFSILITIGILVLVNLSFYFLFDLGYC